MCCVGVSSQLERVLSGPAPDACQVFARHKIGLKGDQWVSARGAASVCGRLQSVTSASTEGCGRRRKGEAETGRATSWDFLTWFICLTGGD